MNLSILLFLFEVKLDRHWKIQVSSNDKQEYEKTRDYTPWLKCSQNSIWWLLYSTVLKTREKYQCLTNWQPSEAYAQSFFFPFWRPCTEVVLKKSLENPAINPNVFDHAINKQDALMQKEMLGQQKRGILSLHTADCSKGRCTHYSVWSGKGYSVSTGKRLPTSPVFMQEFSDTCDLCLEQMWLVLAWNVWFSFGGTPPMLLCSILFYLQ